MANLEVEVTNLASKAGKGINLLTCILVINIEHLGIRKLCQVFFLGFSILLFTYCVSLFVI